MGILESVAKIGLTPAAFLGKEILKVVKPSSPTTQKSVSQITSELTQTTFGKVLGTATTATAAALLVTSGAISKVLPSTKSKVIATIAAPAALTYFADKPENLIKAPVQTLDFSADIGKLLSNPSFSGITQLIQEHPVASSVLGAGAVVAVGKSAIPAVSAILTREEMQKQTAAFERQAAAAEANLMQPLGVAPIQTPTATQDSTMQTNTEPIKTAETTSLKTKKRKRSKIKKSEGVKQSVRINIVNTGIKVQSKRYLNVIPLRNV